MSGEQKEEVAAETKKGFSLKKLLLVVVLAMVGFMGFQYLRQSGFLPGKSTEESQKKEKSREEIIYIFGDNFLVNLLDPDNPRYLKLVLGLSLSNKKVEAEIKKKNVELRDAIIMIASVQTFEELTKEEGKERLKELIRTRMNGILTTGTVEKVYFIDFVIQ
ncbi:MAG: flagellar basal body-associated FliL family protein [Candidatus Caldatribacteriaceae bacterium]